MEHMINIEKKALNRQSGKTIKSIQHHEIIGIVEVNFDDGSCVHIQAVGKSEANVMIIEPNK
jgi:hypothetical protein